MPSITVLDEKIGKNKEIHYETYGKNTDIPLVLIHGWLCNARFWEDFILFKDQGYFLIVPDLRGHGKNEYFGDVSPETMAEDINQILEYLKLRKAIIIGHSMGGITAQCFYHAHPGKVIALGLWNTGGRMPFGYGIGTLGYVLRMIFYLLGLIISYPISPLFRLILGGGWRFAFAMNKSGKNAYKRYVPDVIAMSKKKDGKKAVLKAAFSLASLDLIDKLKEIKVPTMILHGKSDRVITPIQLARKMDEEIPNSKLYIITKTAHFSPNEKPEEVIKVLKEFLENL